MMTREEALGFASTSALFAVDGQTAATVQDAIDSYRDNIRDTLNEERATQYEEECWALFDRKVAEYRAQFKI